MRQRVDREPRKLRRQQRDERLPVRLFIRRKATELPDSLQIGVGKSRDVLRERRACAQKDRLEANAISLDSNFHRRVRIIFV